MFFSFRVNGKACVYLMRSILLWTSADSLLQGLQATAREPNPVRKAISSGRRRHFVSNEKIIYMLIWYNVAHPEILTFHITMMSGPLKRNFCPPVPIQAGNRTIMILRERIIYSQFSNALPTGLKKCLPSPCGSRHYLFRLFALRPSLTLYHPSCLIPQFLPDSAVSPCYCFRCLGAFRRGRTLGLSLIFRYVMALAPLHLEPLSNSLCGPRTKKFGGPGLLCTVNYRSVPGYRCQRSAVFLWLLP